MSCEVACDSRRILVSVGWSCINKQLPAVHKLLCPIALTIVWELHRYMCASRNVALLWVIGFRNKNHMHGEF